VHHVGSFLWSLHLETPTDLTD